MPIPKKLLEQAKAGNAQAQLELGRLHAEGRGVPHDMEEALAWFEKAADLDLPEAVLEVALANEYGLGTDRDYEAAFASYMRAARLYRQPLPFTIRGWSSRRIFASINTADSLPWPRPATLMHVGHSSMGRHVGIRVGAKGVRPVGP